MRRQLGGRRASSSTTPRRAPWRRARTLAEVFGLEPEQVRVISHARRRRLRLQGHAAPAGRARRARRPGRSSGPVKLAVTRQQMFALTGYRTPTIQRVRLGADRDGRSSPISHEALSARPRSLKEFTEQTATADARHVRRRATAARRTGWRASTSRRRRGCARRARARACSRSSPRSTSWPPSSGIDPVELRIAQRAAAAPGERQGVELAQPRRLPARGRRALRLGRPRRPRSAARAATGSASASPRRCTRPTARRRWAHAQRETTTARSPSRIAAADIGTGARTVLTQIAADALEAAARPACACEIGDSRLPARPASPAARWAPRRGARPSTAPAAGCVEEGADEAELRHARTSQGARGLRAPRLRRRQFAEVRVDADTGEVRVDAPARRVRRRAHHQPARPRARSSSAA